MISTENFKILIADDEAFSRYALKTIIDKNIPDAVICGEAENGPDVCRMSGELKPDLILMDIKMPGMNGIEASEKILAVHPEIKIIILSAYDYFSYAQKALDIGVVAYLLKPFKEAQITDRVIQLLKEKKSESESFKSGQAAFNDELNTHLENELLNMLIAPWGKESQIGRLRRFLKINDFFTGLFICLKGTGLSRQKRDWIKSIILEGFSGFGADVGDADLCILVIFNENNDKTVSQFYKNILPFLDKIITAENCSIGLSRPAPPSLLPAAFRQAVYSMQESTAGRKTVIYDGSAEESGGTEIYPFELEDKFLAALGWEQFEDAWNFLEELCRLILSAYSIGSYQAEKLISLFLQIRKTALKAEISAPVIDNDFPLDAIINLGDNNARVKFILDYFNSVEVHAKSRSEENETRKVLKAFRYIQQKIFSDISLESAADYAGISPQYLSRRFKEKYEVNFIDYMTEHRINQARYLLKTTDLNVKEITSEIGYSDPNYFSRVFRKTAGCSPLQYRAES